MRNSSSGIVWQKANRSASMPPADSIRLARAGVGFGPRRIERRIVPGVASLSWQARPGRWARPVSAFFSATGKSAQIRLGVGDHEKFGKTVGIVAGVVGEDVGRQLVLGSERAFSWKIVASGAVSLPRTGRRASIQGPSRMELTDTNACATLPPTASHLPSSGS